MLFRGVNRRSGFTLIELLTVITIVGVLAALIMPIYGGIQNRGNQTKTLSNLRQMGIALLTYTGDNNYQLPNRVQPSNDGNKDADKWPRVMKPYLQDLRIYGCPLPDMGGKSYKVSDPQLYLNNEINYTSYIYNGGNDVQDYDGGNQPFPRLNNIVEASQVILLGIPRPRANNFYMDFAEKNNDDVLNKQAFGEGSPYMFADGSTRVLKVFPSMDNTTRPTDPTAYTDWLWLFNKEKVSIIK